MTDGNFSTKFSDIPGAVPDEEKLNAHPATRKRLEAISDPLERLVKASEIAHQCGRKHENMMALRTQRRVPVVALGRYHGWNKAEIARRIKAKDRRVVDFAFGLVDLRDIPQEWKTTDGMSKGARETAERLAFDEAKRIHAAYLRREAMGTTAREMRRVLVCDLTSGRYGKKYRPVDLGELIGRPPELVTMDRTGSSNRKKKENRAAEAARKRGESGGVIAA